MAERGKMATLYIDGTWLAAVLTLVNTIFYFSLSAFTLTPQLLLFTMDKKGKYELLTYEETDLVTILSNIKTKTA